MKIETTLGTLLATIAVTYMVGQGVGCLKTILVKEMCERREDHV